MDKGMKKVVNLVTNYMSALCETGRIPGRVDRNIEAGTAVYFPGGGAAEFIGSPEYTRSQEYFADLAEDNGFEFYGNGIRIRHR